MPRGEDATDTAAPASPSAAVMGTVTHWKQVRLTRSVATSVPPRESSARDAGRRRTRQRELYGRMAANVASQLRAQRNPGPLTVLAVMPVVGFGEQAGNVVVTSLEALAPVLIPGCLLLVLVNRPLRQAADSTLRRVHRWAARHPAAPVVVADLALSQRPRIGELRQLGVDAAAMAWGPPPGGTAVTFVDDDLVAVPPDTFERLRDTLHDASLAVGPVLFDHPQLPTCLLPDLYTGDLVRALLVDQSLERIDQHPIQIFDDTVESLVLSGNLAVRQDALARLGGLRDLNELTGLARDVLAEARSERGAAVARTNPLVAPRLAGSPTATDPVERLRQVAVRMHSRRALAAYAACGAPTVAQWRSQRLRSSTVDPVRTCAPAVEPPEPLRCLSAGRRRDLLAGLDRHLAVVFDHLHPSLDTARGVLGLLGLSGRDVDVMAPTDGPGWRVRVRRTDGLVERLVALQGAELDGAHDRFGCAEANGVMR